MTFVAHPLVHQVIGCGIAVHRELGPGLLESTYSRCFRIELLRQRIKFTDELLVPIIYKGTRVENAYRIDLLVEDWLVVEVKAIEKLLPVHQAQVLTYLKLSGARQGLLINFNSPRLKDGIKSVLRDPVPSNASGPSTVEKE
jgi:GxxExxY protein